MGGQVFRLLRRNGVEREGVPELALRRLWGKELLGGRVFQLPCKEGRGVGGVFPLALEEGCWEEGCSRAPPWRARGRVLGRKSWSFQGRACGGKGVPACFEGEALGGRVFQLAVVEGCWEERCSNYFVDLANVYLREWRPIGAQQVSRGVPAGFAQRPTPEADEAYTQS